MRFTKMQGAGNDYVLVETSDIQRDWSKMAMAVCERHYGIGADSLLLLMPSSKADFRMRIFDTDGSEAEACGNGIRCLARYAFEKGLIDKDADQIKVETIAGIRTLKLGKENGRLSKIQADMGKPLFRPEEIPVSIKNGEKKLVDIKPISYKLTVNGKELTLNLISMGNPHAVYFWEHPVADFPLSELGPKIENDEIFPNRVNFEVARVINRQEIEARVWERGVGETLACGSGACAIIVAAQLLGYADNKIDVKLPGGTLGVEWNGRGEVLLSGPAEIVFTGEWPD
jgi:diaminopimelate epimerase